MSEKTYQKFLLAKAKFWYNLSFNNLSLCSFSGDLCVDELELPRNSEKIGEIATEDTYRFCYICFWDRKPLSKIFICKKCRILFFENISENGEKPLSPQEENHENPKDAAFAPIDCIPNLFQCYCGKCIECLNRV